MQYEKNGRVAVVQDIRWQALQCNTQLDRHQWQKTASYYLRKKTNLSALQQEEVSLSSLP